MVAANKVHSNASSVCFCISIGSWNPQLIHVSPHNVGTYQRFYFVYQPGAHLGGCCGPCLVDEQSTVFLTTHAKHASAFGTFNGDLSRNRHHTTGIEELLGRDRLANHVIAGNLLGRFQVARVHQLRRLLVTQLLQRRVAGRKNGESVLVFVGVVLANGLPDVVVQLQYGVEDGIVFFQKGPGGQEILVFGLQPSVHGGAVERRGTIAVGLVYDVIACRRCR